MSSNPEQRDNTRFAHISAVTCEDLEKGVYAQSRMYNYSKDGLYFESDLKLEVGEGIFIGIENSPYADRSGTYECYHAVIKRRQALKQSAYKYGYGVLYTDPSLPDEQNGVHADRSPPPDSRSEAVRKTQRKTENRRHQRIRLSRSVQLFSKNRPFRGTLKNIAPGGAFIATDRPFDIGDKLALALPFAKRGEGTLVKAEVVWKNERGIGVKFKKAVRKSG